jgi:hypothetical protein
MYSAFVLEDIPFVHPETLILNSITPVLSKKFTGRGRDEGQDMWGLREWGVDRTDRRG